MTIEESGFYEIQKPSKRYTVIDLQNLTALCGFVELADLQRAQRQRVEQALENNLALRDARWSEALPLAAWLLLRRSKASSAAKRCIVKSNSWGTHVLREESEVYGFKSAGENESLSAENTVFWNETFEDART